MTVIVRARRHGALEGMWALRAVSRGAGGRRDGGGREEMFDGGVLEFVVTPKMVPRVSVGARVPFVGVSRSISRMGCLRAA